MERAKAAQAMRTECDVGAVVDKAAGLVINVLDREGTAVYVNRATEEISGYTRQEILGRDIRTLLIPPEEVAPVDALIKDLVAGRYPAHHENHLVAKDGHWHLFDWTVTVIFDDQGEVEYLLGMGVEVPERR